MTPIGKHLHVSAVSGGEIMDANLLQSCNPVEGTDNKTYGLDSTSNPPKGTITSEDGIEDFIAKKVTRSHDSYK